MIRKIKSYALTITAILTFAAPGLVPLAASAACSNNIADQVATGANDAASNGGSAINCDPTGVGDTTIRSFASKIVNLFSLIVGAVAVIMVIYGGFRYITSGGDSGRVGAAKNSLIYAIVGLVIVALAQLLVHFVLNQASTASAGA